jgi:hypothetical protein
MDTIGAMFELGGALIKSDAERSIRKSNRKVEGALADAREVVRGAANQRAASVASLSRALQSINNARFVRGRETAIARAQSASIREQRASSAGGLEARLRASEEAGATNAAAAFSGASGGFLDVALATQALSEQRLEQRRMMDTRFRLVGDADAIGDMQESMIAGQDTSIINTNLDMTSSQAGNEPYSPGMMSQLLTTALDKDLLRPLVNWGAGFFARGPARGSADTPVFGGDFVSRRGQLDE